MKIIKMIAASILAGTILTGAIWYVVATSSNKASAEARDKLTCVDHVDLTDSNKSGLYVLIADAYDVRRALTAADGSRLFLCVKTDVSVHAAARIIEEGLDTPVTPEQLKAAWRVDVGDVYQYVVEP